MDFCYTELARIEPDMPDGKGMERAMSEIIRNAVPEDAKALLEIYAPYVTDTVITFEYEVPSKEEFRSRIIKNMEYYPYLVFEIDGQPAGYAYASKFRERAAYQWAAELSVYVDNKYHGRRIGTRLYAALIEALKERNVKTVYGVVTMPNEKSDRLHKAFDFHTAGVLKKVGYKHDCWHDVIYYEKHIGDFEQSPESVWK